MSTEPILLEGMKALREKLDMVETEKFISLILRENFDYTQWQRELWNDNKSADEIFYAAKAHNEKKKLPTQQNQILKKIGQEHL